jgi:cysteine-rich repeat protein
VGACTGICTIGSGGTGGFAGAGGSFGGRGGTGGTGASFGGSGGTGGAPSCGNGIVESGEQCDLGASNQDRPALRIGQGGWTMAVTPVDRVVSAQQFYSYSSASSHTGFEVAGYSRILLYRDRTTGLLSLITFHGVDFDSTGQSQPPTAFSQTFDGLPLTSVVVLSDDPGELLKLSTTSARGQWQFVRNSDGGIIGGLPLPGSWSISVNVTLNSGGIRSWEYLDGGGTLATLDLGTTLVIEAFDSPARCRKSRWPGDRLGCTIPFCGDAILDGGEVCDDGNRIGGDGCSADCKSLN